MSKTDNAYQICITLLILLLTCRIMEVLMFFLLWTFVMPYFTDSTAAKGMVQNDTNCFYCTKKYLK